ncbi:MAG: NAD(P)-dependent oxidoreductase [Butyrivibrio sp.]|nr:NAD(P)-dependent oxidoreductase [Butyrivibrio sp.]
MKKIIVSGAGGFLGSHIIKEALRRGDIETIAVSNSLEGVEGIRIIRTGEFLKSDQSYSDAVFINCLFPTFVREEELAAGIEMGKEIIQKAAAVSVGAFINISSQSVYSSVRTKSAKETDEVTLESAYAKGKYESEVLTENLFNKGYYSNVRLASLIGVGYEQRIINRIAKKALAEGVINIRGGMRCYCFLDVRDAARALVDMAVSNPQGWKKLYNLGRNDESTLLELAELIAKTIGETTGREPKVTLSDGEDKRNSALDTTEFMNDFGWKPLIGTEESVRDIVFDLQANGG